MMETKQQVTDSRSASEHFLADGFLLAVILYYIVGTLPDVELNYGLLLWRLPRCCVELANLLFQGIIERCSLLPFLTWLDEKEWTSSFRFRPLPGESSTRADVYQGATEFRAIFLHNKNAIIMVLMFLFPFDWYHRGVKEGEFTSSLKEMLMSLLLGLLVIDLVLGTAHLLSHRYLKRWLWQFHALHHTQQENYFAVKFYGHPFDLEVLLTQCLYAFSGRLLKLDIVTSVLLVNTFSVQLLIEHSGYKIFYISQLHEAHHRYGNVGYYHFPVWEYLFGKLPTMEQVNALSRVRAENC